MGRQLWFLFLHKYFLVTASVLIFAEPRSHVLGEQWTDQTGKHSVEAEFVSLNGDTLTLRKADGRVINVPIDRLSDDSQQQAKKLSEQNPEQAQVRKLGVDLAEVEDVRDLEGIAKLQRTANEAVELYEAFLRHKALTEKEKTQALENLAKWRERAEANLVRWGDNWETVDEIQARIADEERLLKEAHRLIEIGNDEMARDRFIEASDRNPEGIRANFYLGILHALVGRHPPSAEEHFSVCVRRAMEIHEDLQGPARANLAAALNNRAICNVRMNRHPRAIDDWTQALDIAPLTPELVQNLGFYAQLAGRDSDVRVPNSVGRQVADQYARVTVANELAAYQQGVGWLFIPYVDAFQVPRFEGIEHANLHQNEPAEQVLQADAVPDLDFRIVDWATGIAVDEEHLLTARHRAEGAHGFFVTKEGQVERSMPGKIVALSDDSDLVILRFLNLGAKFMTLSDKQPERASDFWAVGFPAPSFVRLGAQVSRGTIVDLDESAAVGGRSYVTKVYHDVELPFGSDGAPLLDNFGNILAIDLGDRTPVTSLTRHSLALPAREIRQFLDLTSLNFENLNQARELVIDDMNAHLMSLIDSSIYQIAIVGRVPRLSWSERIGDIRGIQAKEGWNAYQDPWCVRCNGLGEVRCPARRCANGIRRVQRKVYQGRDPITGREYYENQWRSEKCDTCGGKSHIKCPRCNGKKTEPTI